MTRYFGPIPLTVPETDTPLQPTESGATSGEPGRVWQRVTYVAATLMSASLAFIALAVGEVVSNLVQESYFFLLRGIGAVTGLAGV